MKKKTGGDDGVRATTGRADRGSAEQALRESEERYRELVEDINDAIYELDAGGRITYISPVIEQVSGYRPSEVIGRPFADFIHPDDLSRAVEGFQRSVSGHPRPNEYRILSKRGEVLWGRSFGRRIFEGDRVVGVRGVLTDITERKRAEEALRESEERYRTVFESAFEGIVIHENGVMLDANPAFERMYRYQLSELVGMSMLRLTAQESRDLVLQKFRSASEETYEAVALRKDGTTFRAEVLAKQRTYKGRRVRVVAVRDITERKRAEQALRESEEQWRSLVENIPDIVMILDRDGTILSINRTPPGFTVETTIGVSVYDHVPPEHHDTLRKSLEGVFETGDGHDYEIAAPGPFGRTSWYFNRIGPIVQEGRVVAAAVIATDITERRRAEEALQQSEERYRTLVEAAPDVIYSLSRDGTIVSLNSAFESISGWSRDEWLGKQFAPIIHPDDLPAAMDVFRLVLRGEVPPVGEYRMLAKSGEYRTVEVVPRPLIVDGKVVGTFGIARDISERKRMEEALQSAREELESAVERQMQRGNAYGLTFRELTVLYLVADGRSDKEIGAVLGISDQTAHKHVASILSKMSVASRTEASVRAVREGLLD